MIMMCVITNIWLVPSHFIQWCLGMDGTIFSTFDDDEVGHTLEQFAESLYALTATISSWIVS